MLSKKRKMMIWVAMIIIICLSVIGAWKVGIFEKEENYPLYWDIYMEIEKTDEGWVINVTDIVESNSIHNVTLPPKEVMYVLLNHTHTGVDPDHTGGSIDPYWTNANITIADIKWKASPLYNITWNDNDYNDLLSVGDTFFISSAGGKAGKAETGYEFVLIGLGGGRIILS